MSNTKRSGKRKKAGLISWRKQRQIEGPKHRERNKKQGAGRFQVSCARHGTLNVGAPRGKHKHGCPRCKQVSP